MIVKKIFLDENDKDVYIDCYIADKIRYFERKAILIIPGGGYRGVCSDREGEPIAHAFMVQGYNAFVLHYSVARKKVFPAQLIQASKAMKHIKDNAEEYGINKDEVFAVGFSAGGHLTACLGTLWNKKEVYEALDMPYGYNKPKGIMLIYPVISSDKDIWHEGSFANLLGKDNPSEEELLMCSVEKYVTKDSSPAFMAHTSDDAAVNVRNSLVMADAYAKEGLKFELHIYPTGCHGLALGNEITKCNNDAHVNEMFAKWVENAAFWAKNL